jgi:hypothetical protein
MKYLSTYLVPAFIILLSIISTISHAQSTNADRFEYLSPKPNSSFVSPLNNIIIRYGEQVNLNSIDYHNLINVTGSKSGFHKGQIVILDDGKSIIFKPNDPFSEGEKVTVVLSTGMKTVNNDDVGELEFNFFISDSWQNNINDVNSKILFDEIKLMMPDLTNNTGTLSDMRWKKVRLEPDTLELPNLYVTISDDPTDGYIFISPWFYQGNFLDPNYIMIADNYGIPIYYKGINALALDFKIQPNALLTYHDRSTGLSYGMDSSYNIIDTFACGNGYTTGFHDLQILPNDHYLVMSYDAQTVRMDTIVGGGDSSANVIGLIVQEIDENDNVVFQWRSWDHFNITDASNNIDLTAHTIDYVHGNSIELDSDGNLIISCRHMNEVTKISRATGDIIWRLGGENNQFYFTNDNRGFAYQHDARRLQNGNVTVFDNANLLWPKYSSAIEYQLDEQNYLATRVWDYYNTNHYTPSMGSATRLDNGRTLIGWGGLDNPAVTEVTTDGTKTFEMIFDESVFSYRAFRYSWRTNLLTVDRYNVDFGFVAINDSASEQIIITNNSNEVKVINNFFSRSNLFSVTDEFPISLQPFESKVIYIQFIPDSVGVFSDDIHLRIQEGNEMIAQVISVSGFSDPFVPVELKYFNAILKPGKVKLSWSTATETNNFGFEIERQAGSKQFAIGNWKMISFIKGHGTTIEPKEYYFVDNVADVIAKSIYYRLKQIDLDGTYKYSKEILVKIIKPDEIVLNQNFPNPFNPSTKIKYSIPNLGKQHAVSVQLKIYDVLGNEVVTLVNDKQAAGNYEVEFNTDAEPQSAGGGLSSGIYIYQLRVDEYIATKKMVLLR